jgi:hypothetical protein
MLKDLPVSALIAAAFCTAVYMYFVGEFDVTASPGALLLFVSLALLFTLTRRAVRKYWG